MPWHPEPFLRLFNFLPKWNAQRGRLYMYYLAYFINVGNKPSCIWEASCSFHCVVPWTSAWKSCPNRTTEPLLCAHDSCIQTEQCGKKPQGRKVTRLWPDCDWPGDLCSNSVCFLVLFKAPTLPSSRSLLFFLIFKIDLDWTALQTENTFQ